MPDTGLLDDPLLANVPIHEGYKVLGGVVLYQKLGQGGMGGVYKGRHLRLNVDVAVKVMAMPFGLEAQETDNFIKRFLREAQTAASIDHQNLVRVIDVNTEGGVYYLVMDYVDGESAGERLERKGRLSEGEAVEICFGAAEGLADAHREGIVHRDVKPDNIMIDKKGRVRVTDLGLAKAYAGDTATGQPSMLTQTQTAMGTPHYMSPEQFVSTRTVGPAADVWSLGVTLYHLLTAKLPWTDSSAYAVAFMVTNDPLPDPREVCADLSDAVCTIIEKALSKDPAERYADCSEMATAVLAHLGSIRSSPESLLPDARAGTTKMALITITPPAPKTITMIVQASLGKETMAAARVPAVSRRGGTPVTIATAGRAERSWVLPAAIAGGAALLVTFLMVLLLGGRQTERDPLEARAERFYLAQADAFAAGRDEEVASAIKDADGDYDDTKLGIKIKRLGESAEDRIKAKRDAEAAAARQAAFEAARRAAIEAEKAENVKEAVRQLRLALENREDDELRKRLEAMEERIARVERLLAEAADREKAGDWEAAASSYEKVLKAAKGEDRAQADVRLAEVRRRLAVEKVFVETKRAADDGRWSDVRDRVVRARGDGISDIRLDELEAEAKRALAPRKSVSGPLGVEVVLIRGGTFEMGSADGADDESPVHRVTVPSFYLGRFEVTQAQFEAFRKEADVAAGRTGSGRQPVVSVSWHEAVAFCKHLSKLDKRGATYRLPTEAEWEYAARGAAGRTYPWGNDPPTPQRANLAGDDDGHAGIAEVDSYKDGVTPEGVADLIGNAAEWCADWHAPYSVGAASAPKGAVSGEKRVIRGGAYAFDASVWSRASMRVAATPDRRSPNVGFRVVRELTPDERHFERTVRGE